MEVTVVSKEHVKPSSPTPPLLRIYQHSLVDLIVPRPVAPLIFLYSHSIDPGRLRESLSKVLPRFHPLAGRVKDHIVTECNDAGALFIATRVNCSMSEFLAKPDLLLLRKLMPAEVGLVGARPGGYISQFQVNTFDCGGTAIAVCVAHRFLDGVSNGAFLRAWSETARGCDSTVTPDFSALSFFPVDDPPSEDSLELFPSLFRGRGAFVTRRFLFDSSAIAALKALARSSANENPTRVEAVSAFIWKQEMAARRKWDNGKQMTSMLIHSVNLRGRTKQPLPQDSIGNVIWGAATFCHKDKPERSLADLAGEVRKNIRKILTDIESLTAENAISTFQSFMQEREDLLDEDEADCYMTTSWCRFGYYDIDFGRGKPVWVCTTALDHFLKLAILCDTKVGDGIEVWITLDEKSMDVIENDREMRMYAIPNPCPLIFVGDRPAK